MLLDERAWFGDPAAKIRKERVPETAAACAARAHGARPFPIAAAKVLTLTAAKDFDVQAVVAALESDPPIAVRVLRVVNSPAFGLKWRCTSVRHAVPLLGANGVREAAIAGSVLNIFPGNGTEAWGALHDHAMLTAALARHLAPEWRLPADEMFTTAFLHDIGKWVLLEEEPNYAAVLETNGAMSGGTLEEERGRFGFDHAELTEHMLTAWCIPQPIPRVVGLHHDPGAAYQKSGPVAVRVALLRLVNILAHAMESGEEPDFEALAVTEPVNYLGLSAESLGERYAFLRGFKAEGETAEDTVPPTSQRVVMPESSTAPSRGEEVCAYCNAASFGVLCARCGAHLCERHAPRPGQLCVGCEEKFASRVATGGFPELKTAIGLAGAGAAACMLAPALHGAAWAALIPGVTLLGGAIVGTWRRWNARRSFLSEA